MESLKTGKSPIIFLLLFISGFLAGIIFSYWYLLGELRSFSLEDPNQARRNFFQTLYKTLDVNQDQRDAFEPVLRDAFREWLIIRANQRNMEKELAVRVSMKLRFFLSPRQTKIMEDLFQTWETPSPAAESASISAEIATGSPQE